jgi:CRISPR-associated protein Cas2
MDVLVAYDIATSAQEGGRRLSEVAAICERYGLRVQYSVFECRLDSASLEKLKNELLDVLDPAVDAIDIYRFDRPLDEIRMSLGRERPQRAGRPWIFGSRPEPPVILDN